MSVRIPPGEYRFWIVQIVARLNQLASELDACRGDRGDRNWRRMLTPRERAEILLATRRVWAAIKRWGFTRRHQ